MTHSKSEIEKMLNDGLQPTEEGYKPNTPTLINPNTPKVESGYRPVISERKDTNPKLPPKQK